jgi:beta-mannosidase
VRRIFSLNGENWRLRSVSSEPLPVPPDRTSPAPGSEWLPARVPGDVRADLWRADRIPDPRLAPAESAWVDRCGWCYETRFDVERRPGERVHLLMEGVDYVSWTYLNGRRLAPEAGHEGMFSRQVYEVTGCLGEENVLAVFLQGSDYLVDGHRRSLWERLLDRMEGGLGQRAERFQTAKCQMSFGWDFAPCVRTMGVWDDVYLVRSGEVFIQDLWVRPLLECDASLRVTLTFDAARAGRGCFRLALSGRNFACPPQVHILDAAWHKGGQSLSWTIPVQDPRLWWPWDHGTPYLYRFAVEAYLADDRLSDCVVESVGLRDVKLLRNPQAPPDRSPCVICINDEPVYARGANWVPADILPGEVTAGDYDRLLDRTRQAHMNALRVWGGGLREKRAFYDRCDELGLLVWQEFPLACAFLTRYPRNPEYLDLLEREGRAIVRALRNHPSVVLWCGGNEFHPGRHREAVARLRVAVEQEDGDRPFRPVSPHGGDVHNWDVWHGQAPVTEYETRSSPGEQQFVSEYGLQSPPDVESLRTFLPPGAVWPPGPAWEERSAQLDRLRRYAAPLLAGQTAARRSASLDLETFVLASQRAQALGLQIAIEHLRRSTYICSGTLVWQLNEPWPAICWSLIDYYGRPKIAYHAVRRAYNPLLVSLEYPIQRYEVGDRLEGKVWVINDHPLAFPGCCVEVALVDEAGQVSESWLHTMRVEADSARPVGQVEWQLPQGLCWRVRAYLFQGADLVSENEYDLTFYDPYRVSPLFRFYQWMARQLVRG